MCLIIKINYRAPETVLFEAPLSLYVNLVRAVAASGVAGAVLYALWPQTPEAYMAGKVQPLPGMALLGVLALVGGPSTLLAALYPPVAWALLGWDPRNLLAAALTALALNMRERYALAAGAPLVLAPEWGIAFYSMHAIMFKDWRAAAGASASLAAAAILGIPATLIDVPSAIWVALCIGAVSYSAKHDRAHIWAAPYLAGSLANPILAVIPIAYYIPLFLRVRAWERVGDDVYAVDVAKAAIKLAPAVLALATAISLVSFVAEPKPSPEALSILALVNASLTTDNPTYVAWARQVGLPLQVATGTVTWSDGAWAWDTMLPHPWYLARLLYWDGNGWATALKVWPREVRAVRGKESAVCRLDTPSLKWVGSKGTYVASTPCGPIAVELGPGTLAVHANGTITVALDVGDAAVVFMRNGTGKVVTLRDVVAWRTNAEYELGDGAVLLRANGTLRFSVALKNATTTTWRPGTPPLLAENPDNVASVVRAEQYVDVIRLNGTGSLRLSARLLLGLRTPPRDPYFAPLIRIDYNKTYWTGVWIRYRGGSWDLIYAPDSAVNATTGKPIPPGRARLGGPSISVSLEEGVHIVEVERTVTYGGTVVDRLCVDGSCKEETSTSGVLTIFDLAPVNATMSTTVTDYVRVVPLALNVEG